MAHAAICPLLKSAPIRESVRLILLDVPEQLS